MISSRYLSYAKAQWKTPKLCFRPRIRRLTSAAVPNASAATKLASSAATDGSRIRPVLAERSRHVNPLKVYEGLQKGPSKLHPVLSDIYKAGGEIPGPFQVGDRDIPPWGDLGIPLQVRTTRGSLVETLPYLWLRDSCRCSKCVNQDTMQRSFDTFSIPRGIKPSKVITEVEGLRVTWASGAHESLYTWEWIVKNLPSQESLTSQKNDGIEVEAHVYWGADIAETPPSVSYDEIMADDRGVGVWTDEIRRFGFCYVDGCPIDPAKTEELLNRIAFIRVTHYGGFYDFTSDLTMKDTAYTTLALPAHTDTTYFTDPAGLQMFHLLSHTDGQGGASLLVDGFHAASILKKENPQFFGILSSTPIGWHASGNEGITITPSMKFPVLNLINRTYRKNQGMLEGGVKNGGVYQVRWNNDDRGAMPVLRGRHMELWYAAARRWNEILKRESMEHWAQLKPGRPLIFDNWRVLHGRSTFTGKRRICGGYVNRDDYISRWRNTNFTRQEVMEQIL